MTLLLQQNLGFAWGDTTPATSSVIRFDRNGTERIAYSQSGTERIYLEQSGGERIAFQPSGEPVN